MKTIKKHLELIAMFISVLILFQSCKVYHSDSVSLEQASQEFKRTKIETINNESLKYDGVKFEGDQYYGVKKVNGKMLNMPIDSNFVKTIKLENRTMSTLGTIALPIVVIGVGLAIMGSSLSNSGSSGYIYLAF